MEGLRLDLYISIGMVLLLTSVAIDATDHGLVSTKTNPTPVKTVSVTVGGWNFTLNLDGWRLNDNIAIALHIDDRVDAGTQLYGDWTGVDVYDRNVTNPNYELTSHTFDIMYYPAYPNAPKGNSEYYTAAAWIKCISVLKLPKDILAANQEHNIAVYGSVDKIPDDRKKTDLQNIVEAAIGGEVSASEDLAKDPTYHMFTYPEKLTTFEGHMAYLFGNSCSNNAMGDRSHAIMAVLLDNDTVAVINAYDWNKSEYEDGILYKKSPFDILNALTITKS